MRNWRFAALLLALWTIGLFMRIPVLAMPPLAPLAAADFRLTQNGHRCAYDDIGRCVRHGIPACGLGHRSGSVRASLSRSGSLLAQCFPPRARAADSAVLL